MHHIRTDELNSGRNYLSSLHDGRKIILANTVIDDVAGDPATTAMASFIAKLLDLHHHDERLLDPEGVPWAYSPAAAQSEVAARGRAFEVIARISGGLMGRSRTFSPPF